jgi:hypothetical protein
MHLEKRRVEAILVHQVSDWGSGAAADFGWMREGPSRTGV